MAEEDTPMLSASMAGVTPFMRIAALISSLCIFAILNKLTVKARELFSSYSNTMPPNGGCQLLV
jgi:hypothetical protein